MTETLWQPGAARIGRSALRAYLVWLERREGRTFADHDDLWAWSVQDVGRFWTSIADYYDVAFAGSWTQARTLDPMPHTRWFPGARLNWAEHILRAGAADTVALVCVQEGGGPAREITFAELRRSVAAAAGWLRRAGVRPGERVVAYLPNTEHAVIGALAAASVGAVWACCSPDFGADGTIGRLAQLEPAVLIAADGYHWNGRVIDRTEVVAQLRASLPTVRHVVHVPYVFDRPGDDATPWDDLLAEAQSGSFQSGGGGSGSFQPAGDQPGSFHSAGGGPGSFQPTQGQSGSFHSAEGRAGSFQPAGDQLGSFQPAAGRAGSFQSAGDQPGTFQTAKGQPGSFHSDGSQPGSFQMAEGGAGSFQTAGGGSGSFQPGGDQAGTFQAVEFSHPLWVLFTSGTTGRPKGLVHSHGGITLEGLKWTGLYAGMRPGERMFAVTSTGWALWNMQINTLMHGAGIVLYEGSPGHPPDAVWEVAARTGAQVVLIGAAVIMAAANAGVEPATDLSRLRHVMVSGSALPPAGYHWIAEHVGSDLRIDSTSGGTDISGAFVGANEYTPVRVGRIGGRLAGVDCAAWDHEGRPVIDAVGDLVVTQPMPSMPTHLWNDPDFARYTESYFDTWPGVWRHGDWVTMHGDGSISIHGRSDATLNRHGVRLGSSDFYDVLETMDEIAETLVIGVEQPGDGYWLGLFVVPACGYTVDEELRRRIVATLRTRLTPRHVPDEIVEAPGVPHTLSGKRLEVPIKNLLSGRPLDQAANVAAVDDPEVLRWYARFAATRTG